MVDDGTARRAWRDVYRKAADVADGRTQALLRDHVYLLHQTPQGTGGAGGGGWELLAAHEVTNPAGELALRLPAAGSVSAAYHTLVVELRCRSTAAGTTRDQLTLRLNDEVPTLYCYTLTRNDNGTLSGFSSTFDTGWDIGACPRSGAPAGTHAYTRVELPMYARTDAKKGYLAASVTSTGNTDQGPWSQDAGGWCPSLTAPITALNLRTASGNFAQGSLVRLWGVTDAAGGGGGTADVAIAGDNGIAVTEAPANSFALATRVSADASNALELRTNGLYATAGGAGADVTITGDDSLSVAESPANTFALAVALSADAANAVELRADGLYGTGGDLTAAAADLLYVNVDGDEMVGALAIAPPVAGATGRVIGAGSPAQTWESAAYGGPLENGIRFTVSTAARLAEVRWYRVTTGQAKPTAYRLWSAAATGSAVWSLAAAGITDSGAVGWQVTTLAAGTGPLLASGTQYTISYGYTGATPGYSRVNSYTPVPDGIVAFVGTYYSTTENTYPVNSQGTILGIDAAVAADASTPGPTAESGALRLGTGAAGAVAWRNAADSADHTLYVDGSGDLLFDGAPLGGGGADVTITANASLSVTESPANTFALAAVLSPDAGNALSLHANGLYSTDTTGAGGGLATDPLADVKGDLFAASANNAIGRLPVGTNGQVLTADSTQALGVAWAAAGGGGSFLPLTGGTLTGLLTVQGASSGAYVQDAKVSGEANPRFRLRADGRMEWGAGGGSGTDTAFQRNGAGTLAVATNLEVGGNVELTGSGYVRAGFLTASAGSVRLVNGANGRIGWRNAAGTDSNYLQWGTADRFALLWGTTEKLAVTSTGTLTLTPDSGSAALLANGHVGVGVTPAAWHSARNAVQAGGAAAFLGNVGGGGLSLHENTYLDSAVAHRALYAAAATRLDLGYTAGALNFWNAPGVAAAAVQTFTSRFSVGATGTTTLAPDAGQPALVAGGSGIIHSAASTHLQLAAPTAGYNITVDPAGNIFAPARDNAIAAGHAGGRFTVVYAVAGAINTSSREAKTGISPLDPAAALAAVRATTPVTFDYLAPDRGADAYELPADPEQAQALLEQRLRGAPLEAGARHQAGVVLDDPAYPCAPLFQTGEGQTNASNSVGVLLACLKNLDQRLTAIGA